MANAKRSASSKSQSRQAPANRSVPVLGLVFGFVGLAVLAAIVFGGGGGPSDFSPGDPTVEGSLPAASQSAVGLPAPTVVGQDFDGETVSIENDGTAKAILFLAHWCSVCRNEVPVVQGWIDDGGSVPGATLYSVATGIDETAVNYPPNDWLIGEGWTSPVIVDDADSSVLRAFGAGAFPFWVFVSSDGTVVRRVEGGIAVETFEALLAEAAAA
jgi:hypothetical protein